MTDQLTDVKVTPEQADRAIAMAYKMRENYRGLFSAVCVIVHLQDEKAKLESDMAWIRRRTGFWGEVPAPEAPSKERAAFERWLFDEQGLESVWEPHRNCHKDFAAHLAFKAWQAARSTPPPGDGKR